MVLAVDDLLLLQGAYRRESPGGVDSTAAETIEKRTPGWIDFFGMFSICRACALVSGMTVFRDTGYRVISSRRIACI